MRNATPDTDSHNVPHLPAGVGRPPPRSQATLDAIARAKREANFIDEQLLPAGLRAILGINEGDMSAMGVRLYLIRITAGITDPVEKMMVQQFSIAHHRLLQLHSRATETQSLEAVKVYNAAAARLQGELRRLALAIRTYRAPVSPKTFTVVEQQNVATRQEVTFHSYDTEHKKFHSRDIEVGSEPQESNHANLRDNGQGPQPGADRLRKSGALEGLHTGRP